MGTGIVSVGMASDDQSVLALALVAVAAAAWAILGALLAWGMLRDRSRIRREARSPAALTAVAATAVLGARATGLGWSGVAAALLVLATAMWLILARPALRAVPRRATGTAFMLTVSTQSLSVLAAQLAVREQAAWLVYAALALFALGLASYLYVLVGFDLPQLIEGRGDHWVSGGALAISALAAARIVIGVHSLHLLGTADGSLKTVALVVWALSMAWLPVLIVCEVSRRRLGYDLRRWATVFPVGMYAACSFDVGRAIGAHGLIDFASAWVWIGFALWIVVVVAMLHQAVTPSVFKQSADQASN